jgi:cellulose synthase/poly-beta-1,6-N-acetylglucosamine synthase-like glycosyltransferase
MTGPMLILVALFWTAWALVLYSYGIFPILLAFFARCFGEKERGEEEPAASELPRVAMVVAAFNEAGVLPAKLANTAQIDYPADRFELWIGSDGSDDGTADLLARCADPRVRGLAFSQRRGKISVLNDLMERVDADIVVMSDANTMFAPDSVRKLVEPFQDPRVGCVSGELSLEQDGGVSGEGLYWKYECWIKRNESRLGFLIGCNGGIFAIRRELYQPLPPSTVVEDFVLTMRILERGCRVRFQPGARATEPACPTARAEMTRKVRIGAGGFQALGLTAPMLHPRHGFCAFAFWGHKVLRWLVPLFLLAALAANLALCGSELYRSLLALQGAGAVLAGLAYHARPGLRLPRWTRPISYFYLMNFALFCGFLRFMFRTQRVTWDRAAR